MSVGRKIGKFRINRYEIEDNPAEVKRLFHGMIVVRAEHLFYDNSIEYIALDDGFDPVKDGESCPEYEPIFNVTENGHVWAGFRRIS